MDYEVSVDSRMNIKIIIYLDMRLDTNIFLKFE